MNTSDRRYKLHLEAKLADRLAFTHHSDNPRTTKGSDEKGKENPKVRASIKAAFEKAKKQMDAANAKGRGTVNRKEGHIGNEVYNRGLRMYAKKKGYKHRDDTLEHPDADIDDPKSKIVQGWKKQHGKNKSDAGLAAMHLGSGRKPDKFTKGLLTPKAKAELKKAGVNADDPKDMEARVWSRDAGGTGDEDYLAQMGTSQGVERRKKARELLDKDAEAGEDTVGHMGIGHEKDSSKEEEEEEKKHFSKPASYTKAAFESNVWDRKLKILKLIREV